jgi:hypothetical protein
LAKVINTSEGVTAHRHRNALKEQRLSFFEKIAKPVYKRKQGCTERNELPDPHTDVTD